MAEDEAIEGKHLEDSFYDNAKDEIRVLESAIRKLESRLGLLRQMVNTYEANRAPSQSPNGAEPLPVRNPTITSFKPSLREAIHFVLSAGPEDELRLREIRQRLVARNWLRSDEKGRVNLAQMLSRMADEELEIRRTRFGCYQAIKPFEEVSAAQ